MKQFHEAHNVHVYFPDESAESSKVLLVYDPSTPNASIFPDEKKKQLDAVEKEILKWTNEIANVKSEVVPVEKRWHEAVVGHGGTTLNAYVYAVGIFFFVPLMPFQYHRRRYHPLYQSRC